MAVIHPGLFLVTERFPNRKKLFHQLHAFDEAFQSLCENYQQCSEALRFWSASSSENAPERKREYGELLHELEIEILQYCPADQNVGP